MNWRGPDRRTPPVARRLHTIRPNPNRRSPSALVGLQPRQSLRLASTITNAPRTSHGVKFPPVAAASTVRRADTPARLPPATHSNNSSRRWSVSFACSKSSRALPSAAACDAGEKGDPGPRGPQRLRVRFAIRSRASPESAVTPEIGREVFCFSRAARRGHSAFSPITPLNDSSLRWAKKKNVPFLPLRHRVVTAVHVEDLARHRTGEFAAQINRGVGDFLGLDGARQG